MAKRVLVDKENRKRLVIAFTIFLIIVFALITRLGYIQVVKSDEYSKRALRQNIRDEKILPARGKILDCNGQELAVNQTTYSLWARPKDVALGKTRMDKIKRVKLTAKELSGILNISADKLEHIISSDKNVVRIAKYKDKDVADKIKNADLPGIYLEEEVKRVYPRGIFLSHELGGVTDDNRGLSGLELYYNQELTGTSGRWLKKTDISGRLVASGVKKYQKETSGLNVVLTVDGVIQNYIEKEVKRAYKKYNPKSASCIVMETKTGRILGMSSYPTFDPNNPRTPLSKSEKRYFKNLSQEKKLEYLNKMWRNPCISDTYEPGSTAKLVTVASALEENVIAPNSTFNCKGYYTVTGQKVKCWSFEKPHGLQNVYKAVANSCNPALMQIALKLGMDDYYKYFYAFGLGDRTNVDFPGEAYSIVLQKELARKLDLAIMGFGQTNSVSPIQLVSAISVLGNEGKLMEPKLALKITDDEGNVVKNIRPKVVRKVISKKTAKEMCNIMEYVVKEGSGKQAYIEGYRVGGKTGTAQKPGKHGYTNQVIASFIGMAPCNNPDITILFIVDSPEGALDGSVTATPCAKNVIEKVLNYRDVEKIGTKKQVQKNKDQRRVPNLVNKKCSLAKKILRKRGMKYQIETRDNSKADFIVKAQYPSPGEILPKNGSVYLYKR